MVKLVEKKSEKRKKCGNCKKIGDRNSELNKKKSLLYAEEKVNLIAKKMKHIYLKKNDKVNLIKGLLRQ